MPKGEGSVDFASEPQGLRYLWTAPILAMCDPWMESESLVEETPSTLAHGFVNYSHSSPLVVLFSKTSVALSISYSTSCIRAVSRKFSEIYVQFGQGQFKRRGDISWLLLCVCLLWCMCLFICVCCLFIEIATRSAQRQWGARTFTIFRGSLKVPQQGLLRLPRNLDRTLRKYCSCRESVPDLAKVLRLLRNLYLTF